MTHILLSAFRYTVFQRYNYLRRRSRHRNAFNREDNFLNIYLLLKVLEIYPSTNLQRISPNSIIYLLVFFPFTCTFLKTIYCTCFCNRRLIVNMNIFSKNQIDNRDICNLPITNYQLQGNKYNDKDRQKEELILSRPIALLSVCEKQGHRRNYAN